MYLINEELPYYKTNVWTSRWCHRDDCKPVNVHGISLDRPPPKLRELPENQSASKVIKVPPFDIQEIPNAMRREGMPISAKLMERWFAGVLNYAPTDADLKAEINQKGERYSPGMYDTTTIKIDWVLKFKRAGQRYIDLLGKLIRTENALKALREKLMPFRDVTTSFDTWYVSKENMSALHRYFQFRRFIVIFSFSMPTSEVRSRKKSTSSLSRSLTGTASLMILQVRLAPSISTPLPQA